MWLKVVCTYMLLSFALPQSGQAQKKDDLPKDSLAVYRKIEKFCGKNKLSRFLYRELFRALPAEESAKHIPDVKKKIIIKQDYARFEGKIIRHIHVRTYDPFGYDSRDTVKTPNTFFEKAGNAAHIKTMNRTVRQLLIIKENDRFDSLRVRESERLLRSRSYIHEVVFEPRLVSKRSDSVDIFIRVYDVWGVIVNADVSKAGFTADVKDKSFLGTGHEFQNVYKKDYETRAANYTGNYLIPNIYNTYISTSLFLTVDENNNYTRSLSLNRPFYTAFAKWAGGAYYLEHRNSGFLYNPDSTSFRQNYRFNMQDYWVGKSLQIRKGTTEDARTTQLILSSRILHVHYLEKPPPDFDTLNIYSNETFYFLSVGISKRRYDQDRYLFRYGVTEDVPVGKAYSIINGYQVKNNRGRYYLGARVYWGQYHPWGYFGSDLEYGTFFYRMHEEEGTLIAGMNYFTNIFRLGKWRIRQFVKPQCTIGFNRLPQDNLSINNEFGIRGFNSTGLSGFSRKALLTFQTQSYAPLNILGFRFGPYFISSFGMLGTDAKGFRHSRIYSQYGFGLLIRNENLVYHSLQISIAFYPYIPGVGANIFKINPVKTTDFGLRDFDVGKPEMIAYQ